MNDHLHHIFREALAPFAPTEPEPIDRGPLTQPAELTEADWIEADLAEDANKAERRNRINDAAAMDLERAVQARSEWRLA